MSLYNLFLYFTIKIISDYILQLQLIKIEINHFFYFKFMHFLVF